MCTENQLEKVLSEVKLQTEILLSNKLRSIILFGSYARGDYDNESDIDIMVLADIADEEVNSYTRNLYERVSHIGLENDIVLSLCLVPNERFNRFKDILPFYRNVDREGVKLAVR